MNKELAEAIKGYLQEHDELLKDEYLEIDDRNPLEGHCYVASEVYYHMSDEELIVMRMEWEGESHWFLQNTNVGEIIDLTWTQFENKPWYEKAKGASFLTKEPSKRTQQVIGDLQEEGYGNVG